MEHDYWDIKYRVKNEFDAIPIISTAYSQLRVLAIACVVATTIIRELRVVNEAERAVHDQVLTAIIITPTAYFSSHPRLL